MNEVRPQGRPASAEHARLAQSSSDHPSDWKAIGPYLSERAWGTVREDYSPDGNAWNYFTFEHARSRACRWNEDGLAGISRPQPVSVFRMTFWNGRDPFLKERLFGLSSPEGNHGEDVKEYWWYVDATPTASWLSWRYHYPQFEFPYARLREENARRGRRDREFELIDTGAFDDDKYWQIVVDYAKAAPRDLCVRIQIRNAGPESAELHALPTLWFRNRWSWGDDIQRPSITAASSGGETNNRDRGGCRHWAVAPGRGAGSDGTPARTSFLRERYQCSALVRGRRPIALSEGRHQRSRRPGAATVNPAQNGTKMACWHRFSVPPGESVELRLRLARDDGTGGSDLGANFDRTLLMRRKEADEYYATLRPAGASDDEADVMRQGFAGLIWSQAILSLRRWALAGRRSE